MESHFKMPRPKMPLVPIPDFEERLLDEKQIQQLEKCTIRADPVTGESTEKVKWTYADVVKKFAIAEPSEVYKPTAEDLERFKQHNPHVTVVENNIVEVNPDDVDDTSAYYRMPETSTLFHSKVYDV
jgi:hypothetical protein